jgi:hypothetical protein
LLHTQKKKCFKKNDQKKEGASGGLLSRPVFLKNMPRDLKNKKTPSGSQALPLGHLSP